MTSQRPRTRRTRRGSLLAACVGLLTIAALSAPGIALAISGGSASGSAGAAQYTPTPPVPHDLGLPFTGYVLIVGAGIGLVLLSGGLLLRSIVASR